MNKHTGNESDLHFERVRTLVSLIDPLSNGAAVADNLQDESGAWPALEFDMFSKLYAAAEVLANDLPVAIRELALMAPDSERAEQFVRLADYVENSPGIG